MKLYELLLSLVVVFSVGTAIAAGGTGKLSEETLEQKLFLSVVLEVKVIIDTDLNDREAQFGMAAALSDSALASYLKDKGIQIIMISKQEKPGVISWSVSSSDTSMRLHIVPRLHNRLGKILDQCEKFIIKYQASERPSKGKF